MSLNDFRIKGKNYNNMTKNGFPPHKLPLGDGAHLFHPSETMPVVQLSRSATSLHCLGILHSTQSHC